MEETLNAIINKLIGGSGWVISTILLILSGVGAHKLLSNKQMDGYERRTKKELKADAEQEKQDAIHETNNANKLAYDGDIIALLIKNVETLQGEMRDMQKEQLSQARREATLAARNESLEETNKRLEVEIDKLRSDRRDSDALISELRAELNALKLVVTANGIKFEVDHDDPLKVEIVKPIK